MIINVSNTLRRIFIMLALLVMFGGSDSSPIFIHIPQFVIASAIILILLFIVDRKEVSFSKDRGLIVLYALILGYLVAEYLLWAIFPYAVRIYVNRYIVFFAFILLSVSCRTINELIVASKWFATAIAVAYVALYVVQGNNGSFLGSYQNVASAMSIAMIVVEIDILTKEKWDKKDIVLFLLYLGVLMMTGKRTFLIIPFLILLVFTNIDNKAVPVKENRKRLLKIIMVFALLGVIVFVLKPELLTGINRLAEGVDSGDATSGRDRLWGLAIYIWKENPIFGIGMGGYANFIRYNSYITKRLFDVSLITSVHNIYLQLLAENGVVGFSLYVIFLMYNLIQAIINFNKAKVLSEANIKTAAMFTLFIQIWFLLYGLTGNPLFTLFQLYIYMFAIMSSQSVRNELKKYKE